MGEIFQQLAKNQFSGTLITVTRARVSSDLSVARVYLSIFPDTHREAIMHYTKEHNSVLRNELAIRERQQLRIIPELKFFLDDSIDYEENIDRLLRGEGENPIL